jgi:hypothetical protein
MTYLTQLEQALNCGLRTLNTIRYGASESSGDWWSLVQHNGVWYATHNSGGGRVALQKFLGQMIRSLRACGQMGANTTATTTDLQIPLDLEGQRVWLCPSSREWADYLEVARFDVAAVGPVDLHAQFTVAQLQGACRSKTLSPAGTKAELVGRLQCAATA